MVSACLGNFCPYFFRVFFIIPAFLLVFGHGTVFGQIVRDGFVHYTVNDGLPSSEVHDICQDQDGLIWIATDRGVCSFDGYEFRIYGPADGLNEPAIWRILEDSMDRLWFVGLNGRLTFFQDGEFSSFKYNDLIKEYYPGNVLDLECLVGPDTIYLQYNQGEELFKIDVSGLKLSVERIETTSHSKIKLLSVNHGLMMFRTLGETLTFNWGGEFDVEARFGDDEYRHGRFYQVNDSKALLTFKNQVIEVNKSTNSLRRILKTREVFRVEKHNRGLVHICHDNFIGRYHEGRNDTVITYPSQSRVSGCFQDHEGGHWTSTLNDGVYYSPGSSIMQANRWSISDRVTALMSKNDHLYAGTKNEGLFVFGSDSLIERFPDFGWVWSIDSAADDILVGSREASINQDQFRQMKSKTHFEGGRYWSASSTTLEYSLTGSEWNRISELDGYRTYAVLYYGQNWLLGTSTGVFQFDGSDVIYLGSQFVELTTRISDMVLIGQTVWLTTIGQGILIYDGHSVRSVKVSNSILPSDYCNDIHLDAGNNVWVCTNGGLVKIAKEELPKSTPKLQVFTVRDGLSNNETLNCESHQGYLYIGSKDGLDKMKLDKVHLPDQNNYQLRINHLSSRGKLLPLQGEHKIDANLNDLKIGFRGLCYRCLGELEYFYRIVGLSNTWTSTDQTNVDLFKLPPGDYTFELKCQGYKMMPSAIERFHFSISTPLYLRSWFMLSISFFLMLSAILVARAALKRKQLMTRLRSYQYSTFTAQLNPHFIFNSLNGIQNLFLKKDTAQGVKYMSTFGRLLRGTLKNPDSDLIPLSEELEQVETYVELEQLRMRGKIEFKVSIELNQDISGVWVPPMLLQPLIENSIYHGINPKGFGRIDLSIQSIEEDLLFTIRDNGIGIEAAKENNGTEKQVSYGLNLTQERVSIINFVNRRRNLFEVIDLYKRGDVGTMVRFRVPLIQKTAEE